jgi:hypothetical protein
MGVVGVTDVTSAHPRDLSRVLVHEVRSARVAGAFPSFWTFSFVVEYDVVVQKVRFKLYSFFQETG